MLLKPPGSWNSRSSPPSTPHSTGLPNSAPVGGPWRPVGPGGLASQSKRTGGGLEDLRYLRLYLDPKTHPEHPEAHVPFFEFQLFHLT